MTPPQSDDPPDFILQSDGDMVLDPAPPEGGAEPIQGSALYKCGGNLTAGTASATDKLTLDVGGAILGVAATAGQNLWAVGRAGGVSGEFATECGWAYVWAHADFDGSVTAKNVIDATARKNLRADLRSRSDGVQAFAGEDLSGTVSGAYWVEATANGSVSGTITGGDAGRWASVKVHAGKDVTAKVSSSGYADITANGSVVGGAEAADGWLNVTACGDIRGTYRAADEVVVHAGGDLDAELDSGWELSAKCRGHAPRRGNGFRCSGAMYANVGGRLSQDIHAGGDTRVVVVGDITGAAVTSGRDLWVTSNGEISGEFEAEWVCDVRTGNPEASVNGAVRVRKTAAEARDWDNPTSRSPWVARDRVVRKRLAVLEGSESLTDEWDALRAESELIRLPPGGLEMDETDIPADRVRDLLEHPLFRQGSPRAVARKDGVIVAEVTGRSGVTWVMEPRGDGRYRVADRITTRLEGRTPEAFRRDAFAARWVEEMGSRAIHRRTDPDAGFYPQRLRLGLSLVPLIGWATNLAQTGLAWDAVVAFDDITEAVFGVGGGVRAKRCVTALTRNPEWEPYSYSFRLPLVPTPDKYPVHQSRNPAGLFAVGGDNPGDDWGCFGDAVLRLFGLSVPAIRWLRRLPTWDQPPHASGSSPASAPSGAAAS